jgi:hypothetical protein
VNGKSIEVNVGVHTAYTTIGWNRKRPTMTKAVAKGLSRRSGHSQVEVVLGIDDPRMNAHSLRGQ